MRLRPYRTSDFDHICSWIDDERAHMLWCGGRLPYPLTAEAFNNTLAECARNGDCGLVLAEDNGVPLGFCMLSIKDADNSGFLRFIVVDNSRRGQGLGGQMLERVIRFAGELAGVDELRLIVFDANPSAQRCYEKAGFALESVLPDSTNYGGEVWQRRMMAARIR